MHRPSHCRRLLLVGSCAAMLGSTASSLAAGTAPAAASKDVPSRGDIIPVFETMTIEGKVEKVDFPPGSETVLLFFLSGCPACHKMIPEWNRAYERRAKTLRVVGVLIDREPPGFWSTVSIRFPVLRSPGRRFLRSLNVNRVPLTVRVGAGGEIEDLGLGVVDPIRLGEIFRP